MRCAVFGCDVNNKNKDNNDGVRFYCFPKDASLEKQWVHFCKRKDNINTKNARICALHFTSDDFLRNLQFEMSTYSNIHSIFFI